MPGSQMLLSVYPPRVYPGSDRPASAEFTLPAGAGVPDGGTITIGGVVFQFIESEPFTGDVLVPYNAADTDAQVAASFANLINIGNSGLPLQASSAGAVVTARATTPGEGGNYLVSSSFLVPPAFENFSGGAGFGDWLAGAQRAMVDASRNTTALPLRWGLSRGFQARRFGDPQYDREVIPES